jgi:hypothetical protein
MTRALSLYVNRMPYRLPHRDVDASHNNKRTTPVIKVPDSKNIEYDNKRGSGKRQKDFPNGKT